MGIELAVHHGLTIHIHGGGHVGMAHHFLLDTYSGSHGIQPTAEGMPEGAPAQPCDANLLGERPNDVKGAPRRGNRIGNWLTREQAQELLSLPDRESLKGKRDYAILALLLGCGLRRTELVSEVKIGAIAQRENRWVLVDITGKGNRVRSVAVPAWVKAAIDAWTIAAGITEGKIFRAVRKGGKVWGEDLTPGAVLQIVQQYAREMGLEKLAPHDMRRTCAKLCRKRVGDLEQIKFLLGHASIQTTERYLGAEQDFISAVNDNLGLER